MTNRNWWLLPLTAVALFGVFVAALSLGLSPGEIAVVAIEAGAGVLLGVWLAGRD